MTPNQPYLLRAFYEWIVDNNLTPHIVVDATVDGVDVPTEHVKDGQIILNISPSACGELLIQNDWVSFKARFSGVARELFVPVPAVLAIFARENGAGTVFMDEETQGESAQQPEPSVEAEDVTTEKTSQPGLETVQSVSSNLKASDNSTTDNKEAPAVTQKLQSISGSKKPEAADTVKSTENGGDDNDNPPPKPPRPKGKPSLKVIK